MHLFAPEIGMMGTSGIVGPCILQAAGAGYSFKLPENRSRRRGLLRRRRRQQRRLSRRAEPGRHLEAAGAVRLREQPVRHRGAVRVRRRQSQRRRARADLRHAGRRGRRQRRRWPSTRPPARPSHARERAAGPTLLECKTYRTRAHAEGMGDYTYRTREEVESGKRAARSRGCGARSSAKARAGSTPLEAIDAEVGRGRRRRHAVRRSEPLARSGNGDALVFAEPKAPATAPSPAHGRRRHSATTREITFMQATLEALAEEMARNPAIFVLGEGIGKRGGNFKTTAGLFDRYGPDRLCDTPICERGFIGLACGAAMTGTRPVIDFMFTDFILDAVGEIINQIAKMQYMSSGRLKMPVLLRGCIGIGHSAATHHSGNYYPLFAHFPGLRVVVPSTPYDAKGLLQQALRSLDPVLFLEHREVLAVKGPVPDEEYEIEFGKATVVREGSDVTVVALALMVHHALRSARSWRRKAFRLS